MSTHCEEALRALNEGMSTYDCHNYRGIREVAMCAAWHGYRAEPIPDRTLASFSDRVRGAWSQIRSECATHGGIRPEHGFIQPERPTLEPVHPDVAHVYRVLRDGREVGVVVQETDGTLTSCVGGDCRVIAGGTAEPGALPSAIAELSGGTLRAQEI